MKDKYVKNNNFFRIIKKKVEDSIVWKKIINHIKYVGVGLRQCIRDGKKVCFWTYY